MKLFYRSSLAGLLAFAAWSAVSGTNALALTREKPLEAAQRIEAQTASGLYDPGAHPAAEPRSLSARSAAALIFPQELD